MKRLIFILLALFFAGTASAKDKVLTSLDFAYGLQVEAPDKGVVYALEVPEEVYRKVQRADLGDIRVFNGAGEVVPHYLRAMEMVQEKVQPLGDVPIFPLPTLAGINNTNLSLSVKRSTDGTIIDIDSDDTVPAKEYPTGYLLDLGEKPTETGSLEVYWQTDPEHGSSTVQLEHSSDLQVWRPVIPRVTLVDLEYGGNRVEQRLIELPPTVQRYLKLSWLSRQSPLTLTRVAALSRVAKPPQQLQWASLYNGQKQQEGQQTVIRFDSSYRMPVQKARVEFPEVNSVVSAIIQSRPDDQSQWRQRCRGIFYLLELDGERLESEPCSFGVTGDGQWRLVVLDDGAGLAGSSRSVTLSLGWQGDELLFLARGSGPFVLAYGSAQLANGANRNGSGMISTAIGKHGGEIIQKATVGQRLELGGEKVLQPPPPPLPWRTWLLWGVLVVGVIGMAVMAVKLVRDLRSDGN